MHNAKFCQVLFLQLKYVVVSEHALETKNNHPKHCSNCWYMTQNTSECFMNLAKNSSSHIQS